MGKHGNMRTLDFASRPIANTHTHTHLGYIRVHLKAAKCLEETSGGKSGLSKPREADPNTSKDAPAQIAQLPIDYVS